MYDLPSEDPEEPGLPDEFHDLQPQLLSRTLRLVAYAREDYFTASNLNLYYDVKHPLWHKRPDWFLAVNVSRLYEDRDLRRSYVIWQEGQAPYIAIEFLSPGTDSEDLGRFYNNESDVLQDRPKRQTRPKPPGKFEVYEEYLRVPYYIVYSRYTQQLRYFRLEGGQYQEQPLNPQNPRLWLTDLEIGLGIWEGSFEDVPGRWVRWCDDQGNWLLTDTEQAETDIGKVQAQLRQAIQNLLEDGMDMDRVAQILSLSESQIQAFGQTEP
ncbi:MAG: Uma2 family endonuclease [Acaryochloridaceae cyanobacterium RU_4_10]|nr:Uma2 family endonuclease [Acaryochloridaceae cyanobacterium RU_4_10]